MRYFDALQFRDRRSNLGRQLDSFSNIDAVGSNAEHEKNGTAEKHQRADKNGTGFSGAVLFLLKYLCPGSPLIDSCLSLPRTGLPVSYLCGVESWAEQ